MCKMFRELRADEIDCRVAQISEKGVTILLYKDARVDANILDETVGPMNWQREHLRDNANCRVGIWDENKTQWIWKEDTGTESNTEAEKGLASDSFKRACFQWGIGRELYTAPFTFVKAEDCNISERNGKKVCYDKFSVRKIIIENGVIQALAINNDKTGKTVFIWTRPGYEPPEKKALKTEKNNIPRASETVKKQSAEYIDEIEKIQREEMEKTKGKR